MFVEKNAQDLERIQKLLETSQSSNEMVLFRDREGIIW